MQRGDAKQASKMTKEIMLDCWRKYEKKVSLQMAEKEANKMRKSISVK